MLRGRNGIEGTGYLARFRTRVQTSQKVAESLPYEHPNLDKGQAWTAALDIYRVQ